MPIIAESTYRPDWLYRRSHPSTILPTLLRPAARLPLVRERLEIPDGDFIDLDCLRNGSDRAVILCHGLEGNARRKYMLGMAQAFFRRGWDVVGYNYRGCSGEINRLPRGYHSGATEDLQVVMEQVGASSWKDLVLIGFSMGGNLILKYLGEDPENVLPNIRAAVTFSVPADLGNSCGELIRPKNWVYHQRFLRLLRKKIELKAHRHPDMIDITRLKRVRTLIDFDDLYTAPMHGFVDADDYYRSCSCRQFMTRIRVPALLVSAKNDPFLGPSCYPFAEARDSQWLHLETPDHGGHVGFHASGREYWSECRAVEFISAILPAASK
ncbi:MAG: alpha/beta fold hydrolase [Gemmatimonadales bacterium]|nr:alpha/beta fold hydrolase [Gemmatimonadales bacterium]